MMRILSYLSLITLASVTASQFKFQNDTFTSTSTASSSSSLRANNNNNNNRRLPNMRNNNDPITPPNSFPKDGAHDVDDDVDDDSETTPFQSDTTTDGNIQMRGRVTTIPPGFVRNQQVGSQAEIQFAPDEPTHRIQVLEKTDDGGHGHQQSVGMYAQETDQDGNVLSTVTLVEHMFGDTPQVSGSFWSGDYLYQVSFDADGEEIVAKQRYDEFLDEQELIIFDEEEEEEEDPTSRQLEAERVVIRNLGWSDDPGTLDVMVLYTKAAMCLQAGSKNKRDCRVTARNQRPIEALIDLSIYETNLAYSNSKIPTQLRLVHTELDPDFVEQGIAMDQILRWLRDQNDPHFANVHNTRNRVGADFVVLMVESTEYCGIGMLPSSPTASLAFSVVHYRCSAGYYSFGHEIAHNMGCNHERKSSDNDNGINYGYWEPDFRTIMSYGRNRRVLYYSSADSSVRFQNQVAGNAKANNAGYITQRLQQYANFRETKVPHDDDYTFTLETTSIGGMSGAEGNMFDIRALKDVVITNFAVHASEAMQGVPIAVYRKRKLGPVTFEGSDYPPRRQGRWEEIGTFVVNTEGKSEVSRLGNMGDMKPVSIPAGETQAFYISYTNPAKNLNTYTYMSKSIGDVAVNDDYLEIMTGYATRLSVDGELFGDFEADTGYVWNGMVFYTGSGDNDEVVVAATPKSSVPDGEVELLTTFAGGNGQAGNMFTIQANDLPITIFAFDIHTYSEDKNMRVLIYTKTGSFEGYENSEEGWELICDTKVDGEGSPNPTNVPERAVKKITVQPGKTQSFYVTLTEPTIRYTNGHAIESMSDEYITFLASSGKIYPFGKTHKDRIWNGKVHYRVVPPDPKGVLGTTTKGGNGSYGIVFNVKARQALTITSLWFHTHLFGDVLVEVWAPKQFNQGISATFNKPDNWDMLGSFTVEGKGQGELTKLPNNSLNFAIPRKKRSVLYITLPNGGMRYSEAKHCRNGQGSLKYAEKTKELAMTYGVGVGSPRFGCTYDCRLFNGAILYTSDTVKDATLYLDQNEGEEGWICSNDSECLKGTCAEAGTGVRIPNDEGLNYCLGGNRFHDEDGRCPQ